MGRLEFYNILKTGVPACLRPFSFSRSTGLSVASFFPSVCLENRGALRVRAGSFHACLHLQEGGRSTARSAPRELLPPPVKPAQGRTHREQMRDAPLLPGSRRVCPGHLLGAFFLSCATQETAGFGKVEEGICRRQLPNGWIKLEAFEILGKVVA